MDGFTYMQILSKIEDMELKARRNGRSARDVGLARPTPQTSLAPVTPAVEAVSLPETKSA